MPEAIITSSFATWEGSDGGLVSLYQDWTTQGLPSLKLSSGQPISVEHADPMEYAIRSGYYIHDDQIEFVCLARWAKDGLFVAGDFNGWSEAIGNDQFKMKVGKDGYARLTLSSAMMGESRLFKFVDAQGVWREPPSDSPNVIVDRGARNHYIDPRRSGAHLFTFKMPEGFNWSNTSMVLWDAPDSRQIQLPIIVGRGFFKLSSQSQMGAILDKDQTSFRLFAPRATSVELVYHMGGDLKTTLAMQPEEDGCWSIIVPKNLEGALYHYKTQGPEGPDTMFGVDLPVLDPWARWVRDGEGVVVDPENILKHAPKPFKAPPIEDLVIAETHVRDLVARAPIDIDEDQRRGFAGVTRLLDYDDNPITLLNVNAVEFQPLMEFDGNGKDYHWGYMPINFFSPASAYATIPGSFTRMRELQKMVEAFHRRGIAVILDVVFNHMGNPAGLMFVDKAYYFRTAADGSLSNYSGCGNDFRIESAMAERLCLEALQWWVTAFGVDGFRFDLAELLGVDFLAKAEEVLRKIKPDIVLIAEPWSFRGHLPAHMKQLGYASWNDGYREYVSSYLRGKAPEEGTKYFMSGSVGGMTVSPVQSVNYTESHDDRTWLDKITQNPSNNGFYPTMSDRRITHLMAGMLFASLGVPMIALGQEALRSKYGVNNTYLRGDLNAYDYLRAKDFPGSVEYFSRLIAFRLSPDGRALREPAPDKNYLKFFELPESPAMGILFNAARKVDAPRVLFAINPSGQEAHLPVGKDLDPRKWRVIADHERVRLSGLGPIGVPIWSDGKLEVAAVSVSLWVEK